MSKVLYLTIEPYQEVPNLFVLRSVSSSEFGRRKIHNFICQGTEDYCKSIAETMPHKLKQKED